MFSGLFEPPPPVISSSFIERFAWFAIGLSVLWRFSSLVFFLELEWFGMTDRIFTVFNAHRVRFGVWKRVVFGGFHHSVVQGEMLASFYSTSPPPPASIALLKAKVRFRDGGRGVGRRDESPGPIFPSFHSMWTPSSSSSGPNGRKHGRNGTRCAPPPQPTSFFTAVFTTFGEICVVFLLFLQPPPSLWSSLSLSLFLEICLLIFLFSKRQCGAAGRQQGRRQRRRRRRGRGNKTAFFPSRFRPVWRPSRPVESVCGLVVAGATLTRRQRRRQRRRRRRRRRCGLVRVVTGHR